MERANRKVRYGVVVSDKMDKTVVVSVENSFRHPLYGKITKLTKKYKEQMKKTTKFKAHDENNACAVGDKVKIMETRPLSREKRWRVVEITEKATIV